MGIGKKLDYPPLLAPGRHVMGMAAIRRLCVDQFHPNEKRRTDLFLTLEEFIHRYLAAKIVCEVWLDGSFLTQKPEPDDLDLAVVVEHYVGDTLTLTQQQLVEDTNEPSYLPGLDTFSFVRRAPDDPFYGDELIDGAHTWHEQWGREHGGEWLKGFVVIRLGETDVGLRIRS